MFPSPLNANVIRRYRAARADGMSAAAAHRHAITPEPVHTYESYGADAVRFLLDDPELTGLVVTARTTPDDDPDRSWLGEYTNSWSPDVIAHDHATPTNYPRYFLPCYTIGHRRADLSVLGYARGPAQVEAERQVRQDARLFTELDARIITVSVHKAGVLLGEASVGADFDPNADFEDQLVTFASDILGEAIAEARTALPHLIIALTDDREPHRRSSATPPPDSSAAGTPIVVADPRWGSLRVEQDRSGHTVLHIDPVAPETKARVFLRGTELVDDRITRDDINVTVCIAVNTTIAGWCISIPSITPDRSASTSTMGQPSITATPRPASGSPTTPTSE
ncbi:hypothetical protein NONI108955_20075 [Nocardia ninae]|uniref:Uncharacterized protein n=1 Tax=Nocardia ninae NBRC 108245 TaxID=1210091 RepID=A0A511M7V0_9NOCA|nr:hypothetical protein [Nocardia ninae]GEM36712.1 hypothetical protein NN4_12310 [Nocardia ninae NBRC 108245]